MIACGSLCETLGAASTTCLKQLDTLTRDMLWKNNWPLTQRLSFVFPQIIYFKKGIVQCCNFLLPQLRTFWSIDERLCFTPFGMRNTNTDDNISSQIRFYSKHLEFKIVNSNDEKLISVFLPTGVFYRLSEGVTFSPGLACSPLSSSSSAGRSVSVAKAPSWY